MHVDRALLESFAANGRAPSAGTGANARASGRTDRSDASVRTAAGAGRRRSVVDRLREPLEGAEDQTRDPPPSSETSQADAGKTSYSLRRRPGLGGGWSGGRLGPPNCGLTLWSPVALSREERDDGSRWLLRRGSYARSRSGSIRSRSSVGRRHTTIFAWGTVSVARTITPLWISCLRGWSSSARKRDGPTSHLSSFTLKRQALGRGPAMAGMRRMATRSI